MADAHTPKSVDTSLDRLEAALEAIARGQDAPKLAAGPADTAMLSEVEQRLDAVIEQVKTVLGRKSDP